MIAVKRYFVFLWLRILKGLREILSEDERSYRLLFIPRLEHFRFQIGKLKAWRVFEQARHTTPAYALFLKEHEDPRIPMRGFNPDLSVIPVMDKESYVKRYSIEARCVGGAIPKSGVMVDESSGTSGTPNNWVRGSKERAAVKHILETSVHFLVGDEPIFVVNAFALGPWATGMNVSMSMVDIAILKSTGPDIAKIENTLNFFGPKYRYVVCGYPPFLKALADSTKVEWSKFDTTAFFGGEGISEEMRTYLQKAFTHIYGSYGASDLEINIAAENDFTIALRKKMIADGRLRHALAKHETLPMIFQYNPLDYYIETNAEGELVVTLCRLENVAPKVRYNIHDLGHVLPYSALLARAKEEGISLDDIGKPFSNLPLLFHYGRADQSVAFYGCKITPADIETVIFRLPELASNVHSFALLVSEDEHSDKRLAVALEREKDAEPFADKEKLSTDFFKLLAEVNQDFRESARMIPKGYAPTVEQYPFGEGPFADSDIRLKSRYIQKR